jgi:hypothetical protein
VLKIGEPGQVALTGVSCSTRPVFCKRTLHVRLGIYEA